MKTLTLIASALFLVAGCGANQTNTEAGGTTTMITGSELSGQWTVTHINAVPVTDRANPTMTFDDDGTLSGDASCNNYSTTYVVEGDTVGLGPAIATTRKACVPEINDQETAFLAVLDQITSAPDADGDPATFAIDGDDLAITTAQGDTITATR